MPTKRARTAASPQAGSTGRRRPVLKFRVRVTDGEAIAVGPGKVDLLEAIALTGSITAAAKSLNMSYRRAWLLLDEMNRSMREPVVESAKGGSTGGGSLVTDAGHKVVALYRQIEHDAEAACQRDIRALMDMLAR